MKKSILWSIAAAAVLGAVVIGAHAQQPPLDPPGHPRLARFSPEDRAAFFDARVAGLKAGLRLTPEQEKLWPGAEAALREAAAAMKAAAEARRAERRPADPIEALRRAADGASARADLMRKLADAAQPLYVSLSDDQKGRLMPLLHGIGGAMPDRGGADGEDGFDRGARRGPRHWGRWN